MSTSPASRPGWTARLRAEPGRSLVELVGGGLSAVMAYVALVVATLSWCIPDSCERSWVGVAVGTALFGVSVATALRWLSLRRLSWGRAVLAGNLAAVALLAYEAVDHLL